jgi:hypothetical protein
VREAGFAFVERGCHIEDGFAKLAGDNAAVGKTASIEIPFNFEVDLVIFTAAAQKIGVERVDRAIIRHGKFSAGKRLADDLATENAADTANLAAALEAITALVFYIQQVEQALDKLLFGGIFALNHGEAMDRSGIFVNAV